MIFRSLPGAISTLADKRQVRVRASSESVDLAGDIVDQAGIDLAAFHANPIVLWQHDPAQPIARAVQTGLSGGNLVSLIQFPPDGTSDSSDLAWRLIQAGVVSTVSIGFDPVKTEPLHGGKRGVRYTKSVLLEISFVSIPANGDAAVIARAAKAGARISADTASHLAEIEDAARQAGHHAARAQAMAAALNSDNDPPIDGGGDIMSMAYRQLIARAIDPAATLSVDDLMQLTPDQRRHRALAIENEFGLGGDDFEADADFQRFLDPGVRRAAMRRMLGS